jgi:Uma2 family endonuclease
MSAQIERRPFTVSEYHQMTEAGILTEDDRVELIEGEVVKMAAINSRHAACVNRLDKRLNRWAGKEAIVSVQNPISLGQYSEPQPDLALLRPREDFYAQSHPSPKDVLLVVEVADSSAARDRNLKLPLYAQAAIPEVWLVDLSQDLIEIYARPAKGAYRERRQVKRGESLTSSALPGLTLRAKQILG